MYGCLSGRIVDLLLNTGRCDIKKTNKVPPILFIAPIFTLTAVLITIRITT